VNKSLLRKVHQLVGGGLQMDFGDMHIYEWTNKRGRNASCSKGTFTINFFNSSWRFLRDGKIIFGRNDYFENNENLSKIVSEEMENVINVSFIEKRNKYDYRLYFSNNITLETFEAGERTDDIDSPLYMTDKENKKILDINLLCNYKEEYTGV
jgi:hypothetical protein